MHSPLSMIPDSKVVKNLLRPGYIEEKVKYREDTHMKREMR
jgi:hypothetical protein